MLCLLVMAGGFPLLAVGAWAEDVPVRLEFARDGDTIVAAVRLHIPANYHAYAHEAGGAGRPTVLDFALEGGQMLPVWYPAGAMQRDFYDPEATVFVYEGEVPLFTALPGQAAGKPFTAALSLLLCSSRNCLPVNQSFTGVVPEAPPPVEQAPWMEQWRALQRTQPALADMQDSPAASPLASSPLASSGEQGGLGLPLGVSGSGARLAGHGQSGVLPPPEEFEVQLTPRYADASLEIASLGKALLVGMLAGLLLNVMPCVLPVLTFKISGLLLMGGSDDKEKLRRFREHNLCFAGGVMTLFTGLALVLGLADLMWGQLYQNQGVLLVMLLLVFLMGLSMLGVFTLPVINLKTGENTKNPCLQSYLTGLVSTFLATPCSGPLLGGVLGWAFTQPLLMLMVVFWAVGLGMALPYVLFCIWPHMTRILPRPGPWMSVFERVAGFFLLGTALYLLSILPAEKHMNVLSVLLLVSLCAWLWGRFCGISAPPLRRRAAGVAGCALLLAAIIWVLRPVAPLPQWRDFSPEYFTSQLGKKPMLLEFTADWCPNCKFMEATVLTDERLRAWQARYGMDIVRVDLSTANAYAVRLLSALGSKSIPLTALFPAGDNASSPLVLRDVYGVQSLTKAMNEAFSGG
ncbi:cytochrome c biogenesis protein CcdA [uncultured Desulfovibrio sp.]|uniref:protein-disulfide reductase DsbD family protein n=2 Tax=uncultured Desulfovibrio sp. TaxID=167968 RepID=UPI002603C055|nr:cytochrome c biogenesis protein CcdA [uncultured Desulfovibrio sp.]